MSQHKSREIFLAVKTPVEVLQRLETLRTTWKENHAALPKGLSCSESRDGQLAVVASEAAFTFLPGACVVKSIGAIELPGAGPVFEAGSNSKTLHIRQSADRKSVV